MYNGSLALPRGYLLQQLMRALLLWLLVRALVVVAGRASSVEYVSLHPIASLIVISSVAALAHVDARIMREPIFYANLGVPRWLTATTAAVLALSLEICVRLAAS